MLFRLSGASVLNTTGTPWASLTAGDRLNLTISLGMRNNPLLNWNEKTFLGLTDKNTDLDTIEFSDTVASSGFITNNPATGTQRGDGKFKDVSFSHTVRQADLMRPGNIGILIYSEGRGATDAENQSFFDNVRLQLDQVPATESSAH